MYSIYTSKKKKNTNLRAPGIAGFKINYTRVQETSGSWVMCTVCCRRTCPDVDASKYDL